MDKTVRTQDDPYLWFVYGTASAVFPWGHYLGGGGFYASQWLTISHRPQTEPSIAATIELSSQTAYTDPRDADRVTIDINNTHTMALRDVEYVDSTLNTTSGIRLMSHFGFSTDGSLDYIDADVGNHVFNFTTAVKD